MKGILFKPEMIKAIVEGRKTVTRRLLNPQPFHVIGTKDIFRWEPSKLVSINMRDHADLAIPYAKYHFMEFVYIKEAWSTYGYPEIPFYKDEPGIKVNGIAWHSPMFLPEKFARYFICIKSVRVERLQDITGEDASAEGVILPFRVHGDGDSEYYEGIEKAYIDYYAKLWDSINKKTPWASNPWVWRYEFELVKK